MRWAKLHGHQIHMLDPELDAKGSDNTRPIFNEAISGVKSGIYTGIVVAYLSRAGRDLRLMLDLWDEVEAAGGVVYSARENVDGSTPAGRLQRNLLASINQHELEERREGFERAREASVERGIWQRRQTPRGYDRDPDTRRLVTNSQAQQVQDAARQILDGISVIEVAGQLGMTPNGLRYMLRNRVYLGELTVGDHTNPTAHEPILDPEMFAALQVRFNGPRRKPNRDPALLAKLVRCAGCGHVMTRNGDRKYPSYVCLGHHSGGRCTSIAAISCRKIDGHVEQIAESQIGLLQVQRTSGSKANELRQATTAARTELAAYLEAVDAAGLGPEAADGMRQRRDRLREAESAEQAELARTPFLGDQDGITAYRSLDIPGRNHVLRSLLAAVMVKRSSRGDPPITDKVRVVKFGVPVPWDRSFPERGMGIHPFWPDSDSDDVLGFTGSE